MRSCLLLTTNSSAISSIQAYKRKENIWFRSKEVSKVFTGTKDNTLTEGGGGGLGHLGRGDIKRELRTEKGDGGTSVFIGLSGLSQRGKNIFSKGRGEIKFRMAQV